MRPSFTTRIWSPFDECGQPVRKQSTSFYGENMPRLMPLSTLWDNDPMYSLPAFREVREDVLHSFIRAHPLGTLVTNGADGPEATHLPFFLDASAGLLRCHIARANPQWKQLEAGGRVLVI